MPGPSWRRLRVTETLLAAAVVSMLSALLLPAFSRVRDSARQAACLGNVKSVTRALLMYLADHEQHFPPGETDLHVLRYFSVRPGGAGPDQWDPDKPGSSGYCHRARQANPYLRWPVVLEPYLLDRGVWRCPNAVLEGGARFINGASENWLAHLQTHEGEWGYSTEPWLCPIPSWPAGWGGEVTDSLIQGRMAVPVGGKGRTASPGIFLQSIGVNTAAGAEPSARTIPDPAWYVICADAGATIDDFSTGTLAYPDLCHLECAGPGDWEADWANCPWSRHCGTVGAMKLRPELRIPHARHFGGVNIGFLDGHARWWNSEDVIRESPSQGNRYRGRLRGYGPWGPTTDGYDYDPNSGIPALY